jgi:[acyl-carrier-protein] S-malonyltransferase
MKKTAFIFPGQGAQYVGMAGDFIEKDSNLKAQLSAFSNRTGIDLLKIMQEGPEEKLKETQFTQPAILFHSVAAWKTFTEKYPIKPTFTAGHSLGEFSALVAAGALEFGDALYLVHKRGQFMIKANEGEPFAMSAIIGLSPDKVKAICTEASDVGIVIAANYNTPVQTVISGTKAGVEKAGEIASEAGAKRVIPLAVGGPFHSPLVKKAGIWLKNEMADMKFSNAKIPVVSNVHARPETNAGKIKNNLVQQVTSSVLWLNSINYMIEQGIDQFIEFGPQKVLSGMMKKIDRNVKIYNIDKHSDIRDVIETLEQT